MPTHNSYSMKQQVLVAGTEPLAPRLWVVLVVVWLVNNKLYDCIYILLLLTKNK
jgi:hypothetical protein